VPNQSARLDRLFQSLADPTRRAVLERLSSGPAAVSELARPFRMALPSFAQHLEMLESCGLVKSRKSGRVRTYRIEPRSLKSAERWLEKQRAIWEGRLDQLDSYLMDLKENRTDG
jgi:DNA-binding transcriptional ArsR family regulator